MLPLYIVKTEYWTFRGIVDDVMTAIWEKVAFNAGINAVSAVCRVPCSGVGVVPEGVELCYKIAEETCRIANAHGAAARAEKVKEILDEIENELGVIPNLLKLLY